MAIPPVTPGMAIVFGLIAVAIALFVTEALPPDTTAIAIVVSLVVLRPWTGIDAAMAVSGFSSPATLTIVAMYILSGGIQRTGIIGILGDRIAAFTGTDRRLVLGATVGISGPIAGFVNNTPVVAVFVPMVIDLADRSHVSPSKLLIPLSYASMLGGTLTLIGTSTNLLASDLSSRLIGHAFSMFEFTKLGVIVLLVGTAYLVTVGQRLLPERIHPVDLTDEFDMGPYLWRVYVRESSPLVGLTLEEAFEAIDSDYDVDLLQVVRRESSFVAPGTDLVIEGRDRLTVRTDEQTVRALVDDLGLRLLPRAAVTEAELDRPGRRGILIEAVVPPGSSLIGNSIADAHLRDRYRGTVLAVRRGGDLVHEGLADVVLDDGDGLLVHATTRTVELLESLGELSITEVSGQPAEEDSRPESYGPAVVAIGILAGVVVTAALGLLPIVIAALGGVVAMIVTRVIRPAAAYDAVNWEVIFLLAGVIPLGLALEATGGADLVGALIVSLAPLLPAVAVLGVFFLVTSLLANVITPVASVALMVPIAIDVASRVGSNEVAFVLAVMFAGSTAFMTPIGYQTNLMVYSPGGYRFTDFVRVGGPLQLLLTLVVTAGIAVLWGL